MEGYISSSGWLCSQQTVSSRNRDDALSLEQQEKRDGKGGGTALKASCADR